MSRHPQRRSTTGALNPRKRRWPLSLKEWVDGLSIAIPTAAGVFLVGVMVEAKLGVRLAAYTLGAYLVVMFFRAWFKSRLEAVTLAEARLKKLEQSLRRDPHNRQLAVRTDALERPR